MSVFSLLAMDANALLSLPARDGNWQAGAFRHPSVQSLSQQGPLGQRQSMLRCGNRSPRRSARDPG